MNALSENLETFDLLLLAQSYSDTLYRHSVAVAAYSCLIAQKLNWISQPTLAKLSIAGLFHDIGKKELPIQLINKRKKFMTADEISLFETHPTRGRDLLASTPSFPRDILQIVLQHHENNSETGYPHHTPRQNIHPLAKVIHVSDHFSHLLMEQEHQDLKTCQAVLNEMFTYQLADMDIKSLLALMSLFNCSIPKFLKNGAMQ